MPGFVVYIKRHLPSTPFFESQRRQQSIATRRQDFKDCKQILEDSLTPSLHIKARARLQPAQLSEDLPYGQSGIRRLTPSSIHNSLRSIKQTAVWRLSSFSSGKFCELRDFAYGQNLYVLYAKFPPPKAKRLQLVNAPLIPTGEE